MDSFSRLVSAFSRSCPSVFLLMDFREESCSHFVWVPLSVSWPRRHLYPQSASVPSFQNFKYLHFFQCPACLMNTIELLCILILLHVLLLLFMPLVLLFYEVSIYLHLHGLFSLYLRFILSCTTDLPFGIIFLLLEIYGNYLWWGLFVAISLTFYLF